MLRWLRKWNADKPYAEQIRPFGFLLVYTATTGVFAPLLTEEGDWDDDEFGPGRPPKEDEPRRMHRITTIQLRRWLLRLIGLPENP